MRKTNAGISSDYRIAVLDDEIGIIDSLSVILKRSGYDFKGFTNPQGAIKAIKNEHYDMLILDYLMEQMHGDEVVKKIREFNQEIYILILTGHKDLAPPLETIKTLDIQGYCEKSDKFDQLILLIESGIKSIHQMRTIKKFKEGLNKILQTVPGIYQLKSIAYILEEILLGIMPIANSDNAFILVDDVNNISNGGNKSIYKGIGKFRVEVEDFMSLLGADLIESVGMSRSEKQIVKTESGIIFPIINESHKAIGVLFVESYGNAEGIQLLEIYSRQAAASLSNAFLHSLVNIKNEELNKTYEELKTSYMDTIELLRLAIDAKDVYTRGHSDRVSYYAAKIGKAFNMPEEDQEMLRLGGVFHDIGKIGTADDLLFKTDCLDEKEYDEIKMHTLKGAHILTAVSMFKKVVPLIECHHERVDGKGYPAGIKGDEIPFMARILSVADAFDAMTSDRLYRSKMELDDAINQLKNASGSQFDADVVEKFIFLLCDFEQMQEDLKDSFE